VFSTGLTSGGVAEAAATGAGAGAETAAGAAVAAGADTGALASSALTAIAGNNMATAKSNATSDNLKAGNFEATAADSPTKTDAAGKAAFLAKMKLILLCIILKSPILSLFVYMRIFLFAAQPETVRQLRSPFHRF
jgi:hypothetical protein